MGGRGDGGWGDGGMGGRGGQGNFCFLLALDSSSLGLLLLQNVHEGLAYQ